MAIKRKRVVTALVAMTSLRSISGQSTSKRAQKKTTPQTAKKFKVRKLNRDIHQAGRKIFRLCAYMMDQTLMITSSRLIKSKSDKVGMGANTIVSHDNEFWNNLGNDLTTLVNNGESIAIYSV